MQEKTIKSILKGKVIDWVKSIDDDNVRKLIERDTIITGGAIVSLLTGVDVNDFDVYFKTKETTLAVAKYYVNKFKQNPPSRFKGSNRYTKIEVHEHEDGRVKIGIKSAGIAGESGADNYQYFETTNDPTEPMEFVDNVLKDKEDTEKEGSGKYRPIFLTTNAITLSNKIQVVIRFYGNVEELHENYDFVHCTCSWESSSNNLVLPNAALVSIINKRLKYNSSKYPLCSLIRTRKFIQRGWHIDAGQYLKMAWELNELDLTDMSVLEDQLTGMDSAYFNEVLQLLNDREKEGKEIDSTYLMEVVDRIFG